MTTASNNYYKYRNSFQSHFCLLVGWFFGNINEQGLKMGGKTEGKKKKLNNIHLKGNLLFVIQSQNIIEMTD